MSTAQLWTESYEGEVLGETLFGLLADRPEWAAHRQELEGLALLERATKELAEPLLVQRGIDLGDVEGTRAAAKEMADALSGIEWDDFLGSFEPVISQFLAKYRELSARAHNEEERAIADAYVAHELALATFLRRATGEEEGEPLEPIHRLPHVSALRGSKVVAP